MVGRCRVYGGSMEPVIRSGSRVTFEPIDSDKVELGDIVVARIGESTMLHLVQAIDVQNRQVEISGTDGSSNGWAPLDCVLGICTEIEGRPFLVLARKCRPAAAIAGDDDASGLARPCRRRSAADGRAAASPSRSQRG
jgi:hypothetical protein